jgi:D-sedoheptulose 7-phosphate isomerase
MIARIAILYNISALQSILLTLGLTTYYTAAMPSTTAISRYALDISDTIAHAQLFDEHGTRMDRDVALERIVSLLQGITGHNKIMFVGNGGSASIASHFAVDFTKVGGVRAMCFHDAGHLTCLSNDYSYEQVYEKSVEFYADSGDVLVAISSSGQSENIVRATAAAKARQCTVVTLSGFKPDNPLSKAGHINIYTPRSVYGVVEIAHSIILHALLDHVATSGE